MADNRINSFTSLQTYKTLKLKFLSIRCFICFTSLQTYKTLKQYRNCKTLRNSFTSLQTYKTLKRGIDVCLNFLRFTSLQTYKTLKPQIIFQILTELHILTYAVSLFQIDYTTICIYNTDFFFF